MASLFLHSPFLSPASSSKPFDSPHKKLPFVSILKGNFNRIKRLSGSSNGSSSISPAVCSSSSSSYSPFPTDDAYSTIPSGDSLPSNFCIIEGPETVEDFSQMQIEEIKDNIRSRRNKIFLLMEEVRRLRIQERIKSEKSNDETGKEEAYEMPDIPSSIPFLPRVISFISPCPDTIVNEAAVPDECFIYFRNYRIWWPRCTDTGTKARFRRYFIRRFHSNRSFAFAIKVDPIVASFSGGAVGVVSALMVIEANNVEQQEKKRCKYCLGTGYLACARCSASGVCLITEATSLSSGSNRPLRVPTTERCPNCSGAGKVMCPTCLCTGMVMASEHDPRIDRFD